MLSYAKKYNSLGLSVIPIGDNKVPIGSWKRSQTELVEPNFTNFKGIGLVCGEVSGFLQCIDIDSKYDLTGKLFENYKRNINDADKDLLKKLVVQSTPSGGYHFIFKCKEIGGNQKLANRHCTEEEKRENPKDKVRVLLETRETGGYFMIAPSEGYKIIYGSLENISEITPLERQTLLLCAKLLNEVFEVVTPKKNDIKILNDNVSPFEDWNSRGDVLGLLENEGWKIVLNRGSKNLLLRPGGTGKWSADWDDQKRLFYVFTSSSEFEQGKAYNPSQVLAKIKFRDDFSECAKWLLKEGYGSFTPEKKEYSKQVKTIPEPKIVENDEDYSFVATNEETDIYIEQKRNGTFKMADTTGISGLDEFWRNKNGTLDMILGHDNAGKSVVTWFLAVCDCYFNDVNYIIYAGENENGEVKYKLMQFYWCKEIKDMTNGEFKEAKKWVEEHFTLIKNDEVYSYKDMLAIGAKLLRKKKYRRFIIEPYNVLRKDGGNEHKYDYDAMIDMRVFIKKTGMGITLNIHAASEALRRTYPKEHKLLGGYSMPPNKADAEGGGKFPNKADNFMCIHRHADHPELWKFTELHIQKIKSVETGGKRTFKEVPFLLELLPKGVGFVDFNGINPMRDRRKANSNVQEIKFEEPKKEVIKPSQNFENNYQGMEEKPELNISDDAF